MEDGSTGVLEKNKEYLWSKDKAKNDMMYQDIYIHLRPGDEYVNIFMYQVYLEAV